MSVDKTNKQEKEIRKNFSLFRNLEQNIKAINDIDDSSIWLPRNSQSSQLIRNLGTVSNSIVKVAKA